MVDFDKSLLALSGCPVIEGSGGAYICNPYPIISSETNEILSHEICHALAGKYDYEIFHTATAARESQGFNCVLNLLFDWYHEKLYGDRSLFLRTFIENLHKTFPNSNSDNKLLNLYHNGIIPDDFPNILSTIDLVEYADNFVEQATEQEIRKLLLLYNNTGGQTLVGGGRDVGVSPKLSDYYFKTVSKYNNIIEELSTLWKRNKYEWKNNYFGEINWKNLVGMFIGDKLSLPVFKLFLKISMSRSIYLVIDRSGSTNGTLKTTIMDTAIIITESLRRCNVPISILDVGVTDSVVNDIKSPVQLDWFTPMAVGGTAIGEVCSQIKDADKDSYLLIITDGEPDSFEELLSSIAAFPGDCLTFVIGNSYFKYKSIVKNAIQVEPNLIIREMLNEQTLS